MAIFLNHFEKEFHLVLSRAAHVSVLLGEVVDHGDQVEADQPHAQHPLTLLEGENEAEDEAEEEDNRTMAELPSSEVFYSVLLCCMPVLPYNAVLHAVVLEA